MAYSRRVTQVTVSYNARNETNGLENKNSQQSQFLGPSATATDNDCGGRAAC